MALTLFKDVLLRTRRGLSLYKVYDDTALLFRNRTSLNSIYHALLAQLTKIMTISDIHKKAK